MNTGIGTVYGTVLEHHFHLLFDPNTYCQLGDIKITVTDNQNIFELIFTRKRAPILFYNSEKSTLTKLNGIKAKALMLQERGCTCVLAGAEEPLTTAISLHL